MVLCPSQVRRQCILSRTWKASRETRSLPTGAFKCRVCELSFVTMGVVGGVSPPYILKIWHVPVIFSAEKVVF